MFTILIWYKYFYSLICNLGTLVVLQAENQDNCDPLTNIMNYYEILGTEKQEI